MTLKHKIFIAALKLKNEEVQKIKYHLRDKRLSQSEKQILTAKLAIRDYQNKDALELLQKVTSPDDFIESQRLFFIGAAYNNLYMYPEASVYFSRSIALNSFEAGKEQKLVAFLALLTVYFNTFDTSRAQLVLAELKQFDSGLERQRLDVLHCEFALSIQQKRFSEAEKLVPEVEAVFDKFAEPQAISYLFDLFDLSVAQEKLDDACAVAERMKKFRKYKSTAQITYISKLLSFLQKDSPIYLYPREFDDYLALKVQVELLLAYEKGDLESAKASWEYLRVLQPHNFGENFLYTGCTTLFSLSLAKIKQHAVPKEVIKVNQDKNLESKLVYLLTHSNGPLSKENLFRELWGRDPESKEELHKLIKVAQRARKKLDVEIQTIKGAYQLKGKKAS